MLKYYLKPIHVIGTVSLFGVHMVDEGLLLELITLLCLLDHHKVLFHVKLQRNAIQHQPQNQLCGDMSLESFFDFCIVQLLHQKNKAYFIQRTGLMDWTHGLDLRTGFTLVNMLIRKAILKYKL